MCDEFKMDLIEIQLCDEGFCVNCIQSIPREAIRISYHWIYSCIGTSEIFLTMQVNRTGCIVPTI